MGHPVEFPVIIWHPWVFERQLMLGIRLAETTTMKFFCRHCDQTVLGEPYRVISEEDGVILLNMTVCHSCNEQAKALGLRSDPIPLDLEQTRHRPTWVHTPTATARG
jgi:hypothetical protein